MRIYSERAHNFIDRTGHKYGRLTVIAMIPKPRGAKHLYWLCRCDCGSTVDVDSLHLGCGHTQSCGCLQKDRLALARTTHGATSAKGSIPEYGVWLNMKARCTHKSVDSYKYYGARGIKVCERWMKFENFIEDMGRRPSDGHSIDRIDSNGNYEPSNCKWSDSFEQNNNRSNTRHLTYNGKTMSMFQWSREVGINPVRLHGRLAAGWSVERALTEPVRKNK